MIYHIEGWTLADAFRPQPGWGTRRFTVKLADLGEHTQAELLGAAHNGAPPRYRLTSVTLHPAHGEKRVLWSTPPDPRLKRLARGVDAARDARAHGRNDEAVAIEAELAEVRAGIAKATGSAT
jgi:hypothetical protein